MSGNGIETEGVLKFKLRHEQQTLAGYDVTEMDSWRAIFKQLGIVGQTPEKYEGYGFGNLSLRTENGFLISGTQTGYLDHTSEADCAEVVAWDPAQNQVQSRGEVKPSSESLSHAVIYDANPRVNYVFHVHSQEIWQHADELKIAITNPDHAYGTPEMAAAVKAISATLPLPNILSMGGHEDGIIAFGTSAMDVGLQLVRQLVVARSLAVDPVRGMKQ